MTISKETRQQVMTKSRTAGQSHQMIEFSIPRDRDHPPGKGRVSLTSATPANTPPMMLVDCKNSALGEETSPLPIRFGNFA